ncbi:MAG: hypothetical protein M3Z02_12995 [Actinomycetota bacterium]|nr:hypothetical protein [Actinomycetota bacterium]
MGALQALSGRGVYQRASVVTAVSGGSYIAGAFATVTAAPAQPGDRAAAEPPQPPDFAFRHGSPEEQHIRTHAHYLFPGLAVSARGVINALYGLTANLLLLLVFVFIPFRALGWLLDAAGVISARTTSDQSLRLPAWWWAWGPAMVVSGLTLMYALGAVEVYRRPSSRVQAAWQAWVSRLLGAGMLVTIVMVGTPVAAVGLDRLAESNRPNAAVARVLAGVGFASPSGCYAAAQTHDRGACGAPHRSPSEARTNGKTTDGTNTATGLGFFTALLTLIRWIVRRAGGESLGARKKEPGSASGRPAALVKKVLDRLLPWLGSGLLVSTAAVLAVRWARDAARAGFGSHELVLVAAAVGVFAVLKTISDVNRTSLHPYYREQLASEYTLRRVRDGQQVRAEPVPYQHPLSLSSVAPTDDNGPELVICAAANVTDTSVPPGRRCVSFTFTTRDVGAALRSPVPMRSAVQDDPYRASVADYERGAGRRLVTLPGAVAVSAAAVSPLAGKFTKPSIRLVLGVANVRLGLWLPNPDRAERRNAEHYKGWRRVLWQWQQPGPGLLLLELIGRTHLTQKWWYVTDGGHYDNLGLVEALRRRPGMIYAFDASGDPVGRWSSIGQAIALAREDLGVEVRVNPEAMKALDDQYVETPYVDGEVWYPPVDTSRPADAKLWITKLGVGSTAPWDVRSYARRFGTFPTDSTFHQVYGDEQFEAYRALGEWSANQMLDAAQTRQGAQTEPPSSVDVSDRPPTPEQGAPPVQRGAQVAAP